MSLKRMPVIPSDTISEEVAARKNLQRKRTLSYLIRATEELIRTPRDCSTFRAE